MESTIANHTKSDNHFLRDLKNCGKMDTYPDDPEKQQISLQVERQFRDGFLEAATEAAFLVVNPNDPYDDIYEQLGLNEALRLQNIVRIKRDHKETATCCEDRHTSLDDYHANVPKAIQRAMQMAYWRGQVHALSAIDQAHHHPDLNDVFFGQWAQFHETLIKPWAEEVKIWATEAIEPENGKPHDNPPSLVDTAFERAGNIQAIGIRTN